MLPLANVRTGDARQKLPFLRYGAVPRLNLLERAQGFAEKNGKYDSFRCFKFVKAVETALRC